jgi:hypothetical protein
MSAFCIMQERIFTFVVIKAAAEGAARIHEASESIFHNANIVYKYCGTALSVAVDLCALFLTPLIHCL